MSGQRLEGRLRRLQLDARWAQPVRLEVVERDGWVTVCVDGKAIARPILKDFWEQL